MNAQELLDADMEMQRLAFNLSDALDTLNVHSLQEVVGDLRSTVFPVSERLQWEIRRSAKSLDDVARHFPEVDSRRLEQDMGEMDGLLDLLHKCTGEVKNYKEFVEGLIPLIRKCEAWGDLGPLARVGVC